MTRLDRDDDLAGGLAPMTLSFRRLDPRKRFLSGAMAAFLLTSSLVGLIPPAAPASAADAAPNSGGLGVGGAVRSPLNLERADLTAMPRTTIIAKEKSGANVTYEGVQVAEILKKAGAALGEELRGPALLLVVVVTASDGYHAAFALSELDPAMTDKKVMLADTADGKALPPEIGPLRLIVPDDKRHARWVRQVTRIDVIRVNPALSSNP
jgi:DMSO/TMAO reductase YedYZ molybdopterin-dependent catalytic subunit